MILCVKNGIWSYRQCQIILWFIDLIPHIGVKGLNLWINNLEAITFRVAQDKISDFALHFPIDQMLVIPNHFYLSTIKKTI